MSAFQVYVNGLEFYAYHGVSQEERKVGHRYRVSVTLDVHGDAPESDRIHDTVDYATVAQTVIFVSSSSQFRTLERLGNAIAQSILAHFDRVQNVRVRLEKRLPPAEMMAEAAGVEVEVRRTPASAG